MALFPKLPELQEDPQKDVKDGLDVLKDLVLKDLKDWLPDISERPHKRDSLYKRDF